MRILIVADERAIHMRHWATELKQRGHAVGYAAFGEQPWMAKLDSSYRLLSPFDGYLRYLFSVGQVKKAISDFHPDIVHTYYLTNYAFLAVRASAVPVVVTVAGSDLFVDTRRSWLFRVVNSFTLRHASVVHLVARHMVKPAIRLGAEERKIRIVHEGVNLDAFPPYTDSIRERAPIVVCTRQFRPVHDVGTAVRAAINVLRKQADVPSGTKFLFLGDGPERPKLEERVQSAGDYPAIEFLGAQNWRSVSKVLRAAAVYVSPSRSDGTSVSLLQAFVSGAFPVVSDIPANREWIRDGGNGFLFVPGDADDLARKVLKAINDVELRVRAAQSNRKVILEQANDKLMLREVEKMYEDALRG